MPVKCVDASFVVAWLVRGQRTPQVAAAWESYTSGRDEFVAPMLIYPETVSSIRRLAYRGLLSRSEARGIVGDFLDLRISTPTPPGLYPRALALADRFNLSTVYDTCYLAIADILSCELLTLDRRLYRTAAADFPRLRLVE